jgi:hypothetical protein
VRGMLGPLATYWDTAHLFDLTRLFAQGGSAPAREALYERFERNDAEEPFIGSHQIVALDGVQGLLVVLDRVGRYVADHPEYWVDDGMIRDAGENLGTEAVASAVRAAASANPHVRRFLEAVERRRQQAAGRRTPDYPNMTWSELKAAVVADTPKVPRGRLGTWGWNAGDDALLVAASDLLAETDDRLVQAYLRVFDRRAFPLDPRRLVELAAAGGGETGTAALRALRHLRDDAVRSFAVDRLARADAGGDEVRLLVNNFRGGDERRIESLLDRQADEDAFHWPAHAAVDVFEANPQAEAGPSMLGVYERCRCSICRMGAVEVLLRRQEVPAWMLAECRHDSNPHVREAVVGTPQDRQA